MAEMYAIPAEQLEEVAAKLFVAAGTPEDLAAHVARHLVKANLSGHDSHGVIRIPAYVAQINQGRIDPDARPIVVTEKPGAAVVDAKQAFGQVAASFALEVALRKAKEVGTASVSVRNCNHIGRLGDYSEAAAAQGCIAFVAYGTAGANTGHAAPFGGSQRHLGTNPWSIGVPGKETTPLVVDFATTVVAEGKIQVARAKHTPLPPGSIVDKEGKPTTNAEDFYAGGMILPAGGHKGYGLSLAAAMIGAGLTAESATVEGRAGGVFMVVIDPRAFTTEEAFTGTIDSMAAAVRAVTPLEGFERVMLPGEPEARSREQRQREGVPVPADTWQAITEVAQQLNVELPAVG